MTRAGPEDDLPYDGEPPAAPPARATNSRAAAYRSRRAREAAPWIATVAGVLGVAVVVLVLYIATSGILSPPSPGPAPSATIAVTFGPPVISATTCGSNVSYPTEQLPIAAVTRSFTTAQATIEVVELGDGDILPTVTSRPQATLSALCVGAPPPEGGLSWYAVLVSAHGQDLATYTFAQSWAPVPGASFPATVGLGASLTFVVSASIANRGYGAVIAGVTEATPIVGEGVL